ncbi:hypothetical protein [Arthrobacter sp. Ld5]|uniref:hypothetical protein n=1 Tax=Arthrobacter sp. Ld5 TaxID=649152 RepID=UPI003EBAE1BC
MRAFLLAPPRTALAFLLTFGGLCAVIVGILAMHVWIGGHGAAPHHTADAVAAAVPDSAVPLHHTHASAPGPSSDAGMVVAAASVPVDHAVLGGCGGDCVDEMMLGVCVLAMIVVGVAGLLMPAGRALLSASGRRGPPAPSWVSRPAPTPSLTQLCISRT